MLVNDVHLAGRPDRFTARVADRSSLDFTDARRRPADDARLAPSRLLFANRLLCRRLFRCRRGFRGRRFLAALLRRRSQRSAGRQELQCFGQRQLLGARALGQRGVRHRIGQIGPVAAFKQLDRLAGHRRRVEHANRLLLGAEAAAQGLRLGKQLERLVARHVDRRNARRQAARVFAAFHIGAKSPVRDHDRLAAGRMFAQVARQRKQLERHLQASRPRASCL